MSAQLTDVDNIAWLTETAESLMTTEQPIDRTGVAYRLLLIRNEIEELRRERGETAHKYDEARSRVTPLLNRAADLLERSTVVLDEAMR